MKLRDFVIWAGCAGAAATAPALGLGDSPSRVVLGRPLDVRFPLQLPTGVRADEQCAQAELWLGKRRIEPVSVDTLGQTVHVRSHQPINEPVATVTVRVGCHSTVARSYTFFADPLLSQAPAALPSGAASDVATASPVGQAVTVAVAAATAPTTVPQRAAKKAVHPHALAAAEREPAPDAHIGPVNALLDSAPAGAIAPAAQAADAAAPTDTATDTAQLAPDSGASAPTSTDATDGFTMDEVQTLLHSNGEALRLLEEQLQTLQGQRRLEQTEIASLRAQLETARNTARPLPRWIYALQALLALSAGAAVWLWVRLRRTEDALEAVHAAHTLAPLQPTRTSTGETTGETSADMAGNATAPTVLPLASNAPSTGALTTAAAATASAAPATPAPAHAVPTLHDVHEVPAPPPLAPAYVATPAAPVPPAPPVLGDQFDPLPQWPTVGEVPTASVLVLPSVPMYPHGETMAPDMSPHPLPPSLLNLDDVLERAEFHDMVGEHDEAIALLQAQISAHPASTPRAYLHLLQLFYRLGRTDAFDATKQAFETYFNVQVPALSGFARKGRDLLSSPPEILAQVEAQWPTHGVLALLRQLLVRNTAAEPADQGVRLDLAAFDDLLLLHNVAQTTEPTERGSVLGRLRTTPQEVPFPPVDTSSVTASAAPLLAPTVVATPTVPHTAPVGTAQPVHKPVTAAAAAAAADDLLSAWQGGPRPAAGGPLPVAADTAATRAPSVSTAATAKVASPLASGLRIPDVTTAPASLAPARAATTAAAATTATPTAAAPLTPAMPQPAAEVAPMLDMDDFFNAHRQATAHAAPANSARASAVNPPVQAPGLTLAPTVAVTPSPTTAAAGTTTPHA